MSGARSSDEACGDQGKTSLNMIVIGHVDAGKSTLMGHLLLQVGMVDKKVMHKYEQESRKLGKQSFVYAWILDETGEERNRGVTVDVGSSKFETPQKIVTVLDAPGHKDFIPNMIRGAAHADAAVLVTDSTKGEFETGFDSGGQTREHALLVRSLGVAQIIVVVNKMDTCNWSQERYQEIQSATRTFLMKHVGFKDADIRCIPCSGLQGINLATRPTATVASELIRWYDGPCLVEMIDTFRSPPRATDKPFCLCVSDIFKGAGGAGNCLAGRVDAGAVKLGDKVLILPQNETATVKSISVDDDSRQVGLAGERIAVTLTGTDTSALTLGTCLCDPKEPLKVTDRFEARIVVFNVSVPLMKGMPVLLHYQAVTESATIRRLLCHVHKSTGEVIRNKPRCLPKNSCGNVVIQMSRPVCLELFKNVREMGRFMLRSEGSTLAAGMVTKIL